MLVLLKCMLLSCPVTAAIVLLVLCCHVTAHVTAANSLLVLREVSILQEPPKTEVGRTKTPFSETVVGFASEAPETESEIRAPSSETVDGFETEAPETRSETSETVVVLMDLDDGPEDGRGHVDGQEDDRHHVDDGPEDGRHDVDVDEHEELLDILHVDIGRTSMKT